MTDLWWNLIPFNSPTIWYFKIGSFKYFLQVKFSPDYLVSVSEPTKARRHISVMGNADVDFNFADRIRKNKLNSPLFFTKAYKAQEMCPRHCSFVSMLKVQT